MTATNEMLSNLDIKYHFLIDNILDVVGELDLNGIFTYINPYIYDELGYQPDDIIGREIYEFVHPDDAKKITKVLLRRPKSHDFIPEIRLKNDKNQFIWYEIKARRIKDYNNLRKILITLKNISKVKVLEEKLEKKEENYHKITNSIPEIKFWKIITPCKYERAIRTTSEMLKVIIENIPQCVFWKDTNFKYLGCNGNYSEFNGIEHPESIIGKTDEDLLSNREKIQQIRENETSVMLSGKPLYHTNESWIIEKGENIWLDVNRVPLIDSKGDVNGILVTFEEITDRKIAEEKLRNSEKKYKNLSIELETIMDIIPSMIFVKNKSGIYTKVNQVFADYLKLEKEDIIGKSTFDLFPQELATNLNRDDLEVIKNGIPKLNIEETVEFPSGNVSGIISKVPYYNEKDEINGVIGFAIDISERKELEQRLIKSEERYRELANSLPQVISETDERGNLTFVNNNAYSVFGYTPDDFNKGLNALQMLIPEDRKRAMENIKRVLRGKKEEKMRDNEYTALRKDGSTFPVIIYSSPIIYKDTSVGTRSIIIDITDQKKTEQKLKESKVKYKSLFEKTPMAILLINFGGIIKDCNTSAEVLFGYTKEEVLGIEYLKFDIFPLSTKLILAKSFSKFLKTGVPEQSEIQMYRKDGKMIWINAYPIEVKIAEKPHILVMIQDITEQKVAEQKLKESEEKYRLLFENANDAISILDLEGNFYEVNNLYCTQLGYTREDILESNIRDILTPEYADLVSNRILDIREKGFNIFESAHKAKDGRIIPVEISSKSILYDNKPSILSIVRDITERKVAEQKLKESEENYRLITENTNDIIAVLDDKFRPEYINETPLNKMLGYNSVDYIGKSDFLVVHPDDRKMVLNELIKGSEVGKGIADVRLRHKDGHYIWVESRGKTFIDGNGEKKILFNIRNITERKKAEQQLRESVEKYRILIETAVMGLVEFDVEENKVSYINPKLLEILGRTREELLDEKKFMQIVHPEDLKRLIKSSEDKNVEFRIFTKDGKLKWLSGTMNNRFNQEGKLISAKLWLQDSTESKEVEEIKSTLLTRFSHEFKTPLISITGFADFLLTEHKKKLDEKTLLFLKRIKDGSDRLKMLINSFVESSELGKAIIKVNLRKENLYDLINEALDELIGLIHMREHEIDLNMDKQLITHLDKEKVYTIITSLLINAINYTPKGGKISIQSKIDKKSIIISIKDTGIGLDESEKIRLFKPFGKIERYGKGWDIVVGGMGMGLYISKEIIELHGGKIWVESEGRNKGSTFYFSIPITK